MAILNNQRVYLQLIFKPTYNGGVWEVHPELASLVINIIL